MKLTRPLGWAPRALLLLSLALVGVFLWASPGSGLAQDGGADASKSSSAAEMDVEASADADIPATEDSSVEVSVIFVDKSSSDADSSAGSLEPSESTKVLVLICWLLSVGGSIVALVFARKFYVWMMAQDEGNERMVEIAQAVRDGSDAYLWRQ